MTALLDVQNLNVGFRQDGVVTPAVRGVSFTVNRGEVVALVGESGSGKSVSALSTVSLLGDSAQVTGSVKYDGQELIGADERRLRQVRGNDISFIFQEPMSSLNPLHTIEKQLTESLALHQGIIGAQARGRVLELLEKVGIRDAETRLSSYAHQLSGGQRQRVMIAMALANKPDILIADEPTTALDVTIQAQILDLLKDLKDAEGMGLLFITHDLAIVRRIADRVFVMQQGEVVESGPTAELFANPQHPYTIKLLSAEPSGQPEPVAENAPVVVETDKLKIWFPIHGGMLRRTIGHIKAVNASSLSVRAGETLGIVGESGSGKTTMINMISGVFAPTDGRISLRGRLISDAAPQIIAREGVGRTFQLVRLLPGLSVLENVMAGAVYGHKRRWGREAEDFAHSVLERVGMDAMSHAPVSSLTYIDQKRVELARTLAGEPKVLLLDEWLAGLNPTELETGIELIHNLRNEGRTIVMVEHVMDAIRSLCDRCVVMSSGAKIADGTTDDVLSDQDVIRAYLGDDDA